MALSINRPSASSASPHGKYRVTERLYVDAEGRIVPENSPEAAFVFSTPGKLIPREVAIEKGLLADPDAESPQDTQEQTQTEQEQTSDPEAPVLGPQTEAEAEAAEEADVPESEQPQETPEPEAKPETPAAPEPKKRTPSHDKRRTPTREK